MSKSHDQHRQTNREKEILLHILQWALCISSWVPGAALAAGWPSAGTGPSPADRYPAPWTESEERPSCSPVSVCKPQTGNKILSIIYYNYYKWTTYEPHDGGVVCALALQLEEHKSDHCFDPWSFCTRFYVFPVCGWVFYCDQKHAVM